jgi:Leucine-rich repeat (LRR) protein
MTNLQELDCSSYKLTTLPESICHLTNLTVLWCSYNDILTLLNKVNKLFSLYTLNNQIQ